ncbi:MAG: 2-isopropylmalate synthase [Chloroflexi bacterium]|nr:2-isopropylmalate synthase [Chloroflexota bacterium]
MDNKIIIFDTTLRDGEQAAGTALNTSEKLELARQLDNLRVDVIEAGFPAASPGDFEAVCAIASQTENASVCALARAIGRDIDTAWQAIKHAKNPRIHTFISSSDIHIKYQLQKTREDVLKIVEEMVARAASYTKNVEFSPMDSTRSDWEYVYRMLEIAVKCGATTLNIPDTLGYAIPSEYGCFIKSIRQNVPGADKVNISVHCHNDLGMATANALAAVENGANQVECTINGIGERAGNSSLEEVVMALKTRKDYFNKETNIDTTQLYRTSRMVCKLMGFNLAPNKPVVGNNAFRHQSGIHQDGIIKERSTYEIMNPADIGANNTALVLGKLSGRHAFKERLLEMGYENIGEEELLRAFAAFKELADKKKDVTDKDIESLLGAEPKTVAAAYTLEFVQVTCGDKGVPTATVGLITPQGQTIRAAAMGTGPVDAVCKCIDSMLKTPSTLTEFSVNSVTEGIDALGEVLIKVEKDGKTYIGRGSDTDIIVSSAKAYLTALNRLID